MPLSEEEIKNTILEVIDREDGKNLRLVAKSAAHAIAEKLAKGVLYEVKASISHYNSGADALTVVTTMYGDSIDITGHKGTDGQVVTVTVRTREESDAEKGCVETL